MHPIRSLLTPIAIVWLASSNPTTVLASGFKTGNDLLTECEAGEPPRSDSLNWGICMGYVTGAADALGFWSAVGTGKSCIPQGSQAGQMRDIVIKYLRDNPARRHFDAQALVFGALKEAFGCPMLMTLPPAK